MTVLQVENLAKEYYIGVINHGTLHKDLQSWWARLKGKEDPNSLVSLQQANGHTRFVKQHFWALKDVSFQVVAGEKVAIIGPNGAGKTTLFKLLARLTIPTKGAIRYRGRMASLIALGTGFNPELTGRENVFLNGAILGMNKKEVLSKFDRIVAFSEIEDFIDTPLKRYSSGMAMRLGFAVAAHLDPDILIVDEVLAVGDAKFRQKCIAKMHSIASGGCAILFVSHDQNVVSQVCTRGIVLDKGQSVYEAEINSALEYYKKMAGSV